MKTSTRSWVLVAALVAAVVVPAPEVRAQAPIKIVVPFAAGGTQDNLARVIARHMTLGLNEPVVVENRPGGAGLIGTRHVVRSAPDGRTLLIAGSAFAASAATHQLDFDLQRDLLPVVSVAKAEIFLVAHGSLPARSIADLKQLALRPKGVSCGGLPGPTTLACERMRLLIGPGMVTVPYQSLAPALNAVVAGHVDVAFSPRPGIVSLVAANQLRALAAGTNAPPAAPFEQVPLLKEVWPNMLLSSPTNIFVAAGTPAPVIAMLNREVNRIVALPEVRASLKEQGYEIVGGTPEALANDLAREIELYRQIVKEAGIAREPLR